MAEQQIIMHFSSPPSLEDMQIIAKESLELLPDELQEHAANMEIEIDDFPDEAMESDLDLDDSYDLLAFFQNSKEILPGVERKNAADEGILYLFRRPILDMWCETCDDLRGLVRQIIIEELAQHYGFSDDDISEMSGRHYQGML